MEETKYTYIGKDIFYCMISLVLSTLIAYIFSILGFTDANLIMIYILGVIMVALLTSGYCWGLCASALSVLTFNFFFADPIFTFSVYNPDYLITFGVMLVTSITCSVLTKKVKNYAQESEMKSYRSELLLQASRSLQEASTAREIMQKTVEQLGNLLEKNIYCYMGEPSVKEIPISYKKDDNPRQLDESDVAIAKWCYQNKEDAGFSTKILRESAYMFLAIQSEEKMFAVIAVDMEKEKIGTFEKGIMGTIIHESVLALEKEQLLKQRSESEMRLEKERLRANLLRSISHDLRSPLTSISGNAENLMTNETKLKQEKRQKIYQDIYDDSVWLINLVENLLSVTRIENGTMELNIQGEVAEEVIEEALKHISRRGKQQKIMIDCEEILIAKMDVKLIFQVLINLVDNAVKYTPKGAEIVVGAKKCGDKVVFSVKDNGQGLTAEQKKRVFDMYYTVNNTVSDSRRGMGLGLPLCQAIIQAHGSELKIYDNAPTGTVFRFALEQEEIVL